jgi:hypothetical protein
LALAGAALLVIIVAVVALDPVATPFDALVRGAALLAYLLIFIASVTSLYLRELTRFFGRPFVTVHHFAAVTGLVAAVLHPLLVAVRAGSPSVFLPRFDSLGIFLTLGGRPALYLILIAAGAAVWRSSLGQRWRTVHWLNYLAFWLVTAHALLIGSSFLDQPATRALAWVLAIALLGAFIWKRVQTARLRARAREARGN